MTCPKCRDSRHVRTAKGWARCSCASTITNSHYIKPNIRCGESEYPKRYDGLPPFPLKDLTVSGEYHDFRHHVWRSLAHYESRDLRYEFFDAYRLVEIFLGQDSDFSRVRDLELFSLVVVVLGVSDLPNRMLPPLVCQLLTQRRMAGNPTWLYTPKTGATLRQAYDNTLVDLLGTIYPTVYEAVGLSKASSANLID